MPPVVNGARLLAGAGYRLEFLIRLSGNSQHVAYPENVRVEGVDGQGRKSQSEYIRFVQKAFQFGSPTTSVFWAHDMHGFLPAFLLARRYKRPLIYQIHELTTSNDALAIGGKLVFQFQRFFGRHADIVIVPDAGRANIIHSQLRQRPTSGCCQLTITPLTRQRRTACNYPATKRPQFRKNCF